MNDEATSGRDLVHRETTGAATRVILAVAGCFTLLAPWELLIRPGVNPFQWGMAPFWAISFGALSVGVPCFLGAVFGPSRTLHFDAGRRELIDRGAISTGLAWARTHAFADLGPIVVAENDWSDGPSTWVVELTVAGRKRPLRVVDLPTKAGAEAVAADLERLLRD
ncbi:MAG: hypothetical protein OEL76_11095 [Siculibacillus sp.]|nr:hypothetical protein [Siculibacillus sp.]